MDLMFRSLIPLCGMSSENWSVSSQTADVGPVGTNRPGSTEWEPIDRRGLNAEVNAGPAGALSVQNIRVSSILSR